MSKIWITVEVAPGSDISEVSKEAITLATKLGVTVWFDFNDVRCGARPGDNAGRLVDAYRLAAKTNHAHKVAVGGKAKR